MVYSGKGSYIWEHRNEKYSIEFAFADLKNSCTVYNYGDTSSVPLKRYTFDGEKVYGLRSERDVDGQLFVWGVIGGEDLYPGYPINNLDPRLVDPRYIGMTLFGEAVGVFLKDILDGFYDGNCFSHEGKEYENIRILGEDNVDGITCKKISFTGKGKESHEWILWLSPYHMYRILRFEIINSVRKSVLTGHIKYHRYNDDIWFVKQGILKFTDSSTIINWIMQDDWALNIPLPDSLFQIKFPKGTRVHDHKTNRRYIIE